MGGVGKESSAGLRGCWPRQQEEGRPATAEARAGEPPVWGGAPEDRGPRTQAPPEGRRGGL